MVMKKAFFVLIAPLIVWPQDKEMNKLLLPKTKDGHLI